MIGTNAGSGGLKNEISDFKRRRIREETARLFYINGYAGTTIDAIAEQLDVTKPFIYSYYKNKGELLFDICRTGINLSLEAMDRVREENYSPAETLRLVSERVLRIIIDYQDYIVVYEREEKNLQPKQARAIRKQRNLFDHRLAEILEQGHESGEFNIADPVLTATTIAGMITWVSFWYSPTGKRSETEIIAHTMAMIEVAAQRTAFSGRVERKSSAV